MKDCYDSASRAVVRGVRSGARGGTQAAASGVARPSLWPGLGCACAIEARRAVEASSEAAAQWPVSVPGGQSW